jgi:hypothetical protein
LGKAYQTCEHYCKALLHGSLEKEDGKGEHVTNTGCGLSSYYYYGQSPTGISLKASPGSICKPKSTLRSKIFKSYARAVMDGCVVHISYSMSTYFLHVLSIALPAQTRLKFSIAMMALATAGIFVSDYLEKKLPAPPKGTSKAT